MTPFFPTMATACWRVFRRFCKSIFYKWYVWKSAIYAIPLRFNILRNKSRRVVVFWINHEMCWPFLHPIIDEMLDDRSISICIAIGRYMDGGDRYVNVTKLYSRLKADPKYSKFLYPDMVSRFIRADAFVSPHESGNPFPTGAKRIQVAHGITSYHNPSDIRDLSDFNYIFLASPAQRKTFEQTFNKELGSNPVIFHNIGCPKLDNFLKERPATYGKSKDFGNSTRPVIIYAPTWGEFSSLHLFGEKFIRKLLHLNINVYVKLHPWSMNTSQKLTEGIDWNERLSQFDSEKNYCFIRENDATPYFALSNIMISDISSVALEFMIVTKKPVILVQGLEMPETRSEHKISYWYRGELHREMRKVSICVKDINETISAVKSILKNPGSGQEERNRFSEKALYNPGNAAKCAADKIREIIEEPST